MEFTQSGLLLSFEVTYDSPSLFVAMKVFDDSGASPSLLTTLPMTVFVGNSYRAKYTPAGGKTYLVHKAVYTDGTYTTLDSDYSAGTESFRADDIAGIVLNAMIADYEEAGSVGEAIANASAQQTPTGADLFLEIESEPELTMIVGG